MIKNNSTEKGLYIMMGESNTPFTLWIAGLIIIGFGIFMTGFYTINSHNDERYDTYKVERDERIEESKGKVIAWVTEHTGEKAEVLYLERDSNLYVVNTKDGLYRVKNDTDTNEIEYVIYDDKVIYENGKLVGDT